MDPMVRDSVSQRLSGHSTEYVDTFEGNPFEDVSGPARALVVSPTREGLYIQHGPDTFYITNQERWYWEDGATYEYK